VHCIRDIKVCLNCVFYEELHFHACRESQAEWVREKDKANFCEYFSPATREANPVEPEDLLSKLESLFK
jgi:hypothetical protein